MHSYTYICARFSYFLACLQGSGNELSITLHTVLDVTCLFTKFCMTVIPCDTLFSWKCVILFHGRSAEWVKLTTYDLKFTLMLIINHSMSTRAYLEDMILYLSLPFVSDAVTHCSPALLTAPPSRQIWAQSQLLYRGYFRLTWSCAKDQAPHSQYTETPNPHTLYVLMSSSVYASEVQERSSVYHEFERGLVQSRTHPTLLWSARSSRSTAAAFWVIGPSRETNWLSFRLSFWSMMPLWRIYFFFMVRARNVRICILFWYRSVELSFTAVITELRWCFVLFFDRIVFSSHLVVFLLYFNALLCCGKCDTENSI